MLEPIDLISGQLRDAISDPAAWQTALDSINVFVQGSGAVLLSAEERLRHSPSSSDLAELMHDYFNSDWYARDPRNSGLPLLRQNGIVLDYEFFNRDQIDRYYGEFLTRHNRKWFAGLGANMGGDLWCLALQRSPEKGPFETSDRRRLEAVRARLCEIAIYAHAASNHWLDGAFTAFDIDGTAALILDRHGRIREINTLARSIITGAPQRREGASRLIEKNSLKTFEHTLQAKISFPASMPGASTKYEAEINNGLYCIEITCLVDKSSLLFSQASYLVKVMPRRFGARQLLEKKFGLTKAESRVAMALASGLDVKAMVEAFEISSNTVRAHLKAAYSKTEARSQIRLAALIARLNGDNQL